MSAKLPVLPFFCVFSLFLIALPLAQAQRDDPATGELLENFFRDNEAASESDAQQFLENLENLRNKPLDLNRADGDALRGLQLLNDLLIENFLQYRQQFGPLLNAHELQAVPGWELDDIRRVLPYVAAGEGLDKRNSKIVKGLYEGNNEILLRWGRPNPPNYRGAVEGRPDALAFRYQHNFDNRLRYGLTAENDPGEAWFRGSNRHGFDFYSAHLFAQNLSPVLRTVALGDYSARFGQGLLLQTGFAAGKSAESLSITRGGRKLNAYAAFGEAFFFRGGAATLALGQHLEITALYSNRRRDANVAEIRPADPEDPSEVVFTALQSSGLHRSTSEIEDEKALREQVGGLSATWKTRNGQLSANGLHIVYDKPWDFDPAPYRRFAFQGRRLSGASLDYHWRRRNFFFFGETARSDNGGMATLNGLLLSADQHVTLSALQRSFSREYQSIYAMPFAEGSGAANEQGLYLGADIRYLRRWQLNLYADVYRHPWLRFSASAPSRGRDFLARLVWQKGRNFSAYVQWQSETKEQDGVVEGANALVENRRERVRLHATYKPSPGLELRSRIEWTRSGLPGQAAPQGFVAYQEALIKPLGSAFSAALRYAIFDTENFDTRVFTFENDLFSAISIPAYSGRGSRSYLNLSWRVNRWLRLEGRAERTNLLRAVTTSGQTGSETFWKLQARMRF